MTIKSERCSVCGARVQPKTINYVQEIEGNVYFVAEVPADVCIQCGEQYLSPDTADAIQAAIERGEACETLEVPVYHLVR